MQLREYRVVGLEDIDIHQQDQMPEIEHMASWINNGTTYLHPIPICSNNVSVSINRIDGIVAEVLIGDVGTRCMSEEVL